MSIMENADFAGEGTAMFRKKNRAEGVQPLPRHQTFAVGIILSMLAGYLEAYTYLLRGGVFCNGQTSTSP